MNIITWIKFFWTVFNELQSLKKEFGYSEAYPFFNDFNMTNTKKQVSHTIQIYIVKRLIGRDVCLMVGTFTLWNFHDFLIFYVPYVGPTSTVFSVKNSTLNVSKSHVS